MRDELISRVAIKSFWKSIFLVSHKNTKTYYEAMREQQAIENKRVEQIRRWDKFTIIYELFKIIGTALP